MHISKPCHESYAGMSSSTGGRHCNTCSTTVVDFTKMSTAEIEAYFKTHAGQNICGRYKAGQVSSDTFYNKLLWAARYRISSMRVRPFRAAVLAMVSVMFTLSSCIMGKRADPEALKSFDGGPKDNTIKRSPADTLTIHH